MRKCENCNGRQTIQQGKQLLSCPYCMTEEKLMGALRRAIQESKNSGNDTLSKNLTTILNYLPNWPVIAILEAQELKLNPNLVVMIQDAFQILPFGDVSYVGEKKGIGT